MNYLPQSVNPFLISLIPSLQLRAFSRLFPNKQFNEVDFQKIHFFFSLPQIDSSSLTVEVVNSQKKEIDSSDVIRFYANMPKVTDENKSMYAMFYRVAKDSFQKNCLSEEQKLEMKSFRKTEEYKKQLATLKKMYNLT